MSRSGRNRRHKQPRVQVKPKTIVKNMLILLVVIAIAAGVHFFWSCAKDWYREGKTRQFKHVIIKTDQGYMSSGAVRQVLDSALQPGFFKASSTQIEQALNGLPWVKTVSVRKQWPASLVVAISERVPVAIWNQHAILSESGVVFTPKSLTTVPENLPKLFGPAGDAALLWQNWQSFSAILQPLKFSLKSLTLNDIGDWQMTLQQGTVIKLGDQQLEKRLQRFVEYYPQLLKDNPKGLAEVDLQYADGIAVK